MAFETSLSSVTTASATSCSPTIIDRTPIVRTSTSSAEMTKPDSSFQNDLNIVRGSFWRDGTVRLQRRGSGNRMYRRVPVHRAMLPEVNRGQVARRPLESQGFPGDESQPT